MTIVAASSYYEAIKHLPQGAALCLENVAWDEYIQLLVEMGEYYSERIFYNQGRLEVMAPGMNHEKPKEVLGYLVRVLSDALRCRY